MTAQARFCDGSFITHTWEQIGGKVTHRRTGTHLDVETVIVNPAELIAMGGPDRLTTLLQRAKLDDEWSPARLLEKLIAQVKTITLHDHNELTEKYVQFYAGQLNQYAPQNQGSVAWLGMIEKYLDDRKKSADQGLKRMHQTNQGITQVRQEPADPEAEGKRNAAQTELYNAGQMLERKQGELKQLEKEIQDAQNAAGFMPGLGQRKFEDLQKMVDEVAARKLKSPGIDTSLDRLHDELNRAVQAHEKVKADEREINNKVDELTKELNTAKSSGKCPTCGHKLTKDKTLVTRLTKAIRNLQTSQASMVNLFNNTADIVRETEDKVHEFTKQKASYDAWVNEVNSLKNQVMQQQNLVQESNQRATAAKEAKVRLPVLLNTAEQLRSGVTSALEAVTRLRGVVNTAEDAYKALLAQRAETAAKARAAEEAGRLAAESAVLKAILEITAELQVQLFEAGIGPVVNTCNDLCRNIMPGTVCLVAGEIGMLAPSGAVVSYRSMSDSEKLLTMAGLSIALAAGQEYKLATIGRFESFDQSNQDKVVETLRGLVKRKVLDQAILIKVGFDHDTVTHTAGTDFKIIVKI